MKLTREEYDAKLQERQEQLKELRSMVVWGDWTKVGEKLGISSANAQIQFRRLNSKRHALIVQTLEEVISERINPKQD